MTNNEITKDIRQVIIQVMKLDNVLLPEHFDVESIETWDSLSHMELISELERHFGVTITHADSLSMLSEASIVEIIEALMR